MVVSRFHIGRTHMMRVLLPLLGIGLALVFFAGPAAAQTLPALNSAAGPNGSTTYSLSVQTLLILTMLSFLPAMLLMMTSFTRIIIVLSLLRQAIGTASTPPNQVLVGLALFITFFVILRCWIALITTPTSPFLRTRSPSIRHWSVARPRLSNSC